MNKAIILIGICMLMIGCIDRTEEMCGVLKEGVNSSMRDHINYRNKLCVMGEENASHSYYIKCNTITQTMSVMIKVNDDISEKELLDSLDLTYQYDCIVDKIR